MGSLFELVLGWSDGLFVAIGGLLIELLLLVVDVFVVIVEGFLL
jgi:hypothetical protein